MAQYRWDEDQKYIWSEETEREWAQFAHDRIQLLSMMLVFFTGDFDPDATRTPEVIGAARLMYQAQQQLAAYLAEAPKR